MCRMSIFAHLNNELLQTPIKVTFAPVRRCTHPRAPENAKLHFLHLGWPWECSHKTRRCKTQRKSIILFFSKKIRKFIFHTGWELIILFPQCHKNMSAKRTNKNGALYNDKLELTRFWFKVTCLGRKVAILILILFAIDQQTGNYISRKRNEQKRTTLQGCTWNNRIPIESYKFGNKLSYF